MYALGQSTTIVAQTGISAYGPQAMSSGFDAINSKLPRTLKGSLYIGDLNFGRSKNKIRPNLNAQGPHSVFKRDPVTGKITSYKTYVSNPRNPTGFDEILGYDGVGTPHYNKVTQEYLMPHVHDRTVPGGLRLPRMDEIPK